MNSFLCECGLSGVFEYVCKCLRSCAWNLIKEIHDLTCCFCFLTSYYYDEIEQELMF